MPKTKGLAKRSSNLQINTENLLRGSSTRKAVPIAALPKVPNSRSIRLAAEPYLGNVG
jgi:hypothetical protein